MEYRELTISEAAARGLPVREPIHPFEQIVWFSCEDYETPESKRDEPAARHEVVRVGAVEPGVPGRAGRERGAPGLDSCDLPARGNRATWNSRAQERKRIRKVKKQECDVDASEELDEVAEQDEMEPMAA